MENLAPQNWLAGLAGWNMLGDQDTKGLQQQQQAHNGKRTSSQQQADARPRQAFSDITNSTASRGADAGKSVKASGARVMPSHFPQLSQQQFTDPSLIDGVQHAEKKRRDWIDVDAMNMDDPQACAAYAPAIFQYLRDAELQRRPNPLYLENFQHDINAKMRSILVDWLVEVAEEYKLCADTLYLTVNFIDRFLSMHSVQRGQLQLVGVACMWIAAKYEEIYPPNVNDFVFITDNTYTREQMVAMEETILKKLSYELTVPTSKTFLRRYLQVCNPDEHLHFLSNYLTELSMLDHNMIQFLPSQVAAAAVYLANAMLKRQPWDGTLQHYSTYASHQLRQPIEALNALHQSITGNNQLAAIREKYGHPRFQAVSRIPGVSNLTQWLV